MSNPSPDFSLAMTKGIYIHLFSEHRAYRVFSVMSGIITGPYFINYFHRPRAIAVGSMVAVLEIGALSTCRHFYLFICSCTIYAVTSLAAGRFGDIIGRKGTLFTGAVIFTLGGAVQTFSGGFYSMIIGRIISGFGVGLLS